jgi:ubiquinone/menaquinone biosynthesis C-methylase UbiE
MSKDCSNAIITAANTSLPFSQSKGVIDIGCGRGGVLFALLTTHNRDLPTDVPITAIDASPGMIDQLQHLKQEHPELTRLKAEVQDANNLSEFKDGSFTHVLSAFTIYFLPPTALQEAYRITAPGGSFTTSSFGQTSWWDMMSTISLIKPEFVLPDLPEAWKTTKAMTETMLNAGFKDVVVKEVRVGMPYEDAEEMVKFLNRTMPYTAMMTSGFTDEEMVRWEGLCVEYLKRECPGGKMGGLALVGVGRK